MSERPPYRLIVTAEELRDAISGKEPKRPNIEDLAFVAKETAQIYSQALKVAGVFVASLLLSLVDSKASIHDKTIESLG